ncbi:hypothetical protein, partial [Nonomuraea sp. NPDC059022]|uniref:hypothetical protein n=1 Tax=Nonomuraea sp. NPDC059022 TaxID=3346705 RepID=UPI00368DF5A8
LAVAGGDIADGFVAQCGRQLVSWPAFFFWPHQAWRLAERLAAGPLTHPVAVAMHVTNLEESKSKNSWLLSQRVPGSWLDRPGEADDRERHVVIRHRERRLLAPYAGRWVLALGLWELWDWGPRPRTDIRLWLESPHQIVEIPPPPTRTTTRYTPR